MPEQRYSIRERIFTGRRELIQELLNDTMQNLSQGIQKNQHASMLLSGGTTPGDFYKTLSNADLSWGKVIFGMTDERWVSPDDIASNERFIHSVLLQNKAKAAQFMVLKTTEEDIVKGVMDSAANIAAIPVPYDMVLLGMGLDGHVASLFPDSPDTRQAMDLHYEIPCHYIRRDNETPRITMTLRSLLNSKKIGLYFYGKDKWTVYQQAKSDPLKKLPVSAILQQDKVPVTVYWTV